jgi:hypothetical protein
MVRIVNGVIVDQQQESTNSPTSSEIQLFGYVIPIWCPPLFIFFSFLLGGLPAATLSGLIFGIGYIFSNQSSSIPREVKYFLIYFCHFDYRGILDERIFAGFLIYQSLHRIAEAQVKYNPIIIPSFLACVLM